jgi:hypothetical protein
LLTKWPPETGGHHVWENHPGDDFVVAPHTRAQLAYAADSMTLVHF